MSTAHEPGLHIADLRGFAWVQDGGRRGHMHEGVPRGGALVPELLRAANLAVGNEPHAAALEVMGTVAVRTSGAARLIATSDGAPVLVGDDVTAFTVSRRWRVGYVAVAGGIAVPPALDGSGTLVAYGIGGFHGRRIAGGDVLPVGPSRSTHASASGDTRVATESARAFLERTDPIAVIPGPDAHRFDDAALPTLLRAPFRISPVGDRSGLRLEGPLLGRQDDDGGASAPMVMGAVQVPASGAPIVLGPDHPTTGGYPLIAVVASSDLGRLFARRPGAEVRFRAVPLVTD